MKSPAGNRGFTLNDVIRWSVQEQARPKPYWLPKTPYTKQAAAASPIFFQIHWSSQQYRINHNRLKAETATAKQKNNPSKRIRDSEAPARQKTHCSTIPAAASVYRSQNSNTRHWLDAKSKTEESKSLLRSYRGFSLAYGVMLLSGSCWSRSR